MLEATAGDMADVNSKSFVCWLSAVVPMAKIPDILAEV